MEIALLIAEILLSITAFLVVIFFTYVFFPNRYPKPTESDYSHHRFPSWHIYYLSKYPSPIKRGEKGKGFEKHFAENSSPAYNSQLIDKKEITIKMVGDLMTRKDIVSPSSPHLFDAIGDYLFDADLTLGNLEFAVNPDMPFYKTIRYSVPYHFTDPYFKDIEKFGKFGAVALANNHINDSYHSGITSTIKHLDNIGITHSGAAKTKKEQDNFPILDINGVKIAFLSYTFSTNNVPFDEGFEYGTNLIRFNALKDDDYDPSLILHQIKIAKERGAELIVSSHHWGIEFEYYPSSRLIDRAHELMDAGIDIIMGHHPHILNPSEWYKTKDGRNALSIYSLSNLVNYALAHPMQNLAEIASVVVEFGKDDSGNRIVRLKSAEKMPTYFIKQGFGKKVDNRILPLFEYADKLERKENLSFLNLINRLFIKIAVKQYKKYFYQKRAFSYK